MKAKLLITLTMTTTTNSIIVAEVVFLSFFLFMIKFKCPYDEEVISIVNKRITALTIKKTLIFSNDTTGICLS